MCNRARVNAVFFEQLGSKLKVAGASSGNPGRVVYIKLTSNRRGRVRSHFERLVPVEEVGHLYCELAERRRASREAEAAATLKREEAAKNRK